MFLLDAGEAQIDDVEVIPDGGSNQIPNSGFANANGWFFQGTHQPSAISGGVLQLRATNRGDLGSNRIRAPSVRLWPAVAGLQSAPAHAGRAARRLLLLRLLGNYLEVPALLEVPRNLGSPGAANSQLVDNAPPIDRSRPPPASLTRCQRGGQDHRARKRPRRPRVDYIGLPDATPLRLRSNSRCSTMGLAGDLVAGDGISPASVPGQAGGTLVAFQIELAIATGLSQFPAGGATEGLVRWGDGAYAGDFPPTGCG